MEATMTETPTPITDYISTAEASERAGVARTHIQYLLRVGRMQGHKIGHDWLVFVPSLDAYIANRPRRGLKPGTKLGPRRKPTS
jgi:excisionase family DNA binding protein